MNGAASPGPHTGGFAFIQKQFQCERDRRRRARESYKCNLILLILAVLLWSFWLHRHINPLIKQISVISTASGVFWLLFRTAQNWVDSPAFQEPPRTWTRRLLGQPSSRLILIVVLLLAVVLALFSQSIYFEYDPNKATGSYTIELTRGGHLDMPPAIVNSYDSAPGRIYVNPFAFNDEKLVVRITDPPFRYEPMPVDAGWFSRRIKVPTDFKKRTNRAFRIVPGNSLTKLNPINSIPSNESALYFDITVDKNNLLDTPLPLFHEATYFGGPREMIELLINDEREAGRLESNTIGHMTGLALRESDETDRNRIERRARLLAQSWNIVPTKELSACQAIEVNVYSRSDNVLVFSVSHQVSITAGIHTIYLNPPEDGSK